MKKLLSLLFVFVWGAVLCAQTSFSIEQLKIKPGETLQAAIRMHATENIKGFQLDVYLPEGLSFEVQNSKPVSVLTEWGAMHTISSKIQTDGAARFVVVSMSGDLFEANDAPVIKFNLIASDEAQLGKYTILIKKVVVSPENGAKQKIEEIENPVVKIYRDFDIKAPASAQGTVTGTGTYESGTEATLTATPDEGYHFVKWSDGTTDNPYTFTVNETKELNAIFEPNKYEITYSIDGEVFQKESLDYGIKIITPEAPAKEGHTFTGWADVPQTMPAKDVNITDTYTVNKYTLLYKIDGEEYKKASIDYGTTITPEAAPMKEGHTFRGWSEIPATMPAKDVAITGSFTVNIYRLVYKVDDAVYQTIDVAYGELIILIDEPTKEGYDFSGWSTVPETMPAHDMEVTGGFMINSIPVLMKLPELVDVYTLQGILVKKQILSESLEHELPKGIYIINGNKLAIGHKAY